MPLGSSEGTRPGGPGLQPAFTSLSLAAPDASLFTFAPPPGATVKELQLPVPRAACPADRRYPGVAEPQSSPR